MKELNQMREEMKEIKYNIFEDECYLKTISRENSSYAESLDYGGYDSEEEILGQNI